MSLRTALSRTLATTATRRATTLTSHFAVRTNSPIRRTMASLPSTMKGVIIEKNGGTDVLQYKADLPLPQPKEGQVLVKNDFVGINYIDTYFRTGLYPAPSFPYILGREAEGTIVKTGGGEMYGLKEGDKVVWMAEGAYAEYTVAAAAKTVEYENCNGAGELDVLFLLLPLRHHRYSPEKFDEAECVAEASRGMSITSRMRCTAGGETTQLYQTKRVKIDE